MIPYYTTTTTYDQNLPSSVGEAYFDVQGLISLVCELFEVRRSEICQHTKEKNCKFARWVIWKFCKDKGDMTDTQCAELFPGCHYDRSTVVHSRRKLPEDLDQFKWLRDIVEKVEAEINPKTVAA